MSGETFVALCGGIGGAKLALGLDRVLPPGALTLIVNTGDDFEHLGLHVSPDIDTVVYTLAGIANPQTGWGLRDETWTFMDAIERLGGPTWFRLGDGDLATHVERTRRLRNGDRLSDVTADLAHKLGVTARVLPMSDDPVRTLVDTDEGALPFQQYFVARACRPRVRAITFDGAATARLAKPAASALADRRLTGIIICPSNPYLSVDPLLAIPGMREAVRASGAPVIAVTPLIGGKAVKGPTAKIMAELGQEVTVRSIVRHYDGLIDGFVLDATDADLAGDIAVPVHVANTLMLTLDDRVTLAEATLAFCRRLSARRVAPLMESSR